MAFQRGILGVKKDPTKQILFSFNTREGEEWPEDDSDDSDYDPIPEMKNDDLVDLSPTKSETIEDMVETDGGLVPKERAGIKLTIKKSRITNSKRHSKKKDKDEGPTKRRKSAEKHRKSSGTEETTTEAMESTENGQPTDDAEVARWGDLPPELLLKIFQCVTEEEGALPFLPRISRVCMAWSEVARHPALWIKVDLSYGWVTSDDRTLIKLCPLRLMRAREISLSSWKNLTDLGLEAIADHCPLLESLDVSYCSKIKGAALHNLVTKCTKLKRLNISNLNNNAVMPQSLKNILDKCGPNLKSLEMSGNKYTGFASILTVLQNVDSPGASCHNIEVLDISNCWFSTDFIVLNLEKLQKALPRLSILRLANSKLRACSASGRIQAESPGFPMLKELSIAVSTASPNGGIGINDEFMNRILKTSLALRLLDLRGTSHISLRGLQALQTTDLEQLYLTNSSVAKHTGLQVVMHKWRHSLRILDLSWNTFPDDEFELAMEALSGDADASQLEVLHLSGTSVDGPQVRTLLKGCPKLTTLTLTSCRGLPRGMKRDYTDKVLDDLRANINKMLKS